MNKYYVSDFGGIPSIVKIHIIMSSSNKYMTLNIFVSSKKDNLQRKCVFNSYY
jgi:hypothetical protein